MWISVSTTYVSGMNRNITTGTMSPVWILGGGTWNGNGIWTGSGIWQSV